jgi:hypothetical protein
MRSAAAEVGLLTEEHARAGMASTDKFLLKLRHAMGLVVNPA